MSAQNHGQLKDQLWESAVATSRCPGNWQLAGWETLCFPHEMTETGEYCLSFYFVKCVHCAAAAPKRCNQQSLPFYSVVGKCISISFFASYLRIFCSCISLKTHVNILKSYVANSIYLSTFLPLLLPFPFTKCSMHLVAKMPQNKQNISHIETERWKSGTWALVVQLRKAWRQRRSTLPTRQVCNITFRCFRSLRTRTGALEIAAGFCLLKG